MSLFKSVPPTTSYKRRVSWCPGTPVTRSTELCLVHKVDRGTVSSTSTVGPNTTQSPRLLVYPLLQGPNIYLFLGCRYVQNAPRLTSVLDLGRVWFYSKNRVNWGLEHTRYRKCFGVLVIDILPTKKVLGLPKSKKERSRKPRPTQPVIQPPIRHKLLPM